MRICAVMKYPPIQGGVSAQCYWLARELAQAGHEVHVVTNADEVEDEYRILMSGADRGWLEPTFARGRVRLWSTEPFSMKFLHVPQSNPFVSKLAGLAAQVVRQHRCELIFSNYLEPYGVAAHLAASWTCVPHAVHHAGSDIGRLMNRHGLDTTYQEVFRRAHAIFAGTPYPFLGLGASPESIYKNPRFYLPTARFNPDVLPLDFNAHFAELRVLRPDFVTGPATFDPAVPTIGIYGKLGWVKGSYDLLHALGLLRREGLRFNFVAITGGRGRLEYLKTVQEQGLGDVTWTMPFMPHWKIGRFIRACHAICFLEREFPITFHTPTIPREILASATCLVLSGEIARKQHFCNQICDGKNLLLVPDPRIHSELAQALRRIVIDPAWAVEVGQRGRELVGTDPAAPSYVQQYEAIFADTIARYSGRPSTFSAHERGLPATRAEALRVLAAAPLDALGEDAGVAITRYLAAQPSPPSSIFDDALGFCATLRSRPWDASLMDAIRYAERMVWMGRLDEEDAAPTSPHRADAWLLADRPGLTFDAAPHLAPLIGPGVKVEHFTALRPGFPASETTAGERILIFHKEPNMKGHHFKVNAWTAGLLGRCDGSQTIEALIAGYQAETGQTTKAVTKVVIAALQRFYREGLILFVVPTR